MVGMDDASQLATSGRGPTRSTRGDKGRRRRVYNKSFVRLSGLSEGDDLRNGFRRRLQKHFRDLCRIRPRDRRQYGH